MSEIESEKERLDSFIILCIHLCRIFSHISVWQCKLLQGLQNHCYILLAMCKHTVLISVEKVSFPKTCDCS